MNFRWSVKWWCCMWANINANSFHITGLWAREKIQAAKILISTWTRTSCKLNSLNAYTSEYILTISINWYAAVCINYLNTIFAVVVVYARIYSNNEKRERRHLQQQQSKLLQRLMQHDKKYFFFSHLSNAHIETDE